MRRSVVIGRLGQCLLALGLAVSTPAQAEQPAVPQVYLVQTSGWMLPFYTEPTAASFRGLLSGLVDATQNGGRVVVADFNQDKQVPGRSSPGVEFDGAYNRSAVTAAVAHLMLRKQPNGSLTDADFNGALVGAVTNLLKGQSGIIWMVTNNKNSRNNSQLISENTRDFAERLNNTGALNDLVAYPIRLSTGLIIYGIAYGPEAASALRDETRGTPLRQLFPDPAMQLKPLDQATVVFTPTATSTPGLTVAYEDGTLLLDGVPGGRESEFEITGTLTSRYYPQVIQSAQLTTRWTSLGGIDVPEDAANMRGSVVPAEIHDLQPQQSLADIHLRLRFPELSRQGGLAGLLQSPVLEQGTILIQLTGLQLRLQDGFSEKLAQIAAMDQLPSVFSNYLTTTSSETQLPIRVQVRFSTLPLILAVAGAALSLTLLAAAGIFARRSREHSVSLGGQIRRVRARPFETVRLTNGQGKQFNVRGTLVGRPRVTEVPGRPASG